MASCDSVVLTLARPSPVAVATAPAVIALSPESAARTACLIALGTGRAAVRAGRRRAARAAFY
ncbi:MAG: hypothetical protein ACLP8S_07340 [Solirubrobacteraceae bacterium]